MGAQRLNVLNSDRVRAIDELIATGNQTSAAHAAGVTDRTLRRWLSEPAFVAALDAAQDAALDTVTGALVRTAGAAVDLLKTAIEDDGANLALRIRAAEILLSATLRWRELRDVERRLTALEQIFSDDRGTP